MVRSDRPHEEIGQPQVARKIGLFAASACALLVLTGFGPERSPSASVASIGRADANVASGLHIEALGSNPASVKRGKGQAFELGYLRDPWDEGNNFYISSADNSSPLGLAGGFQMGYEAGKRSNGDKFSLADYRITLGAGARSDVAGIMIGASGRRISLTETPTGGKEVEKSGWTGDAGLAIDLAGGVMLGVTIRNVLDIEGIDAARRIAAGVAYGSKRLILEGTGSWALDGEQPIYRAGLMVPLGDVASVRAGYVHDSFAGLKEARQTVTLGASVVLGRVRLDAGGELNVGEPSEVRFGFSMVYSMPYAM